MIELDPRTGKVRLSAPSALNCDADGQPQASKTRKGRTGRPPVPIDPSEVYRLASLGGTTEQIAYWFGLSDRGFQMREGKDPAIADARRRGESERRFSLLGLIDARARIEAKGKGSGAMLIFMAKTKLGWRENLPVQPIEITTPVEVRTQRNVESEVEGISAVLCALAEAGVLPSAVAGSVGDEVARDALDGTDPGAASRSTH